MMQHTSTRPATKEEAFLQHLRQATAAQHKQLEATKLSAELLRADVSPAMYMAYLAHMRGVIAFAEQEVYPVVVHLFTDLPARYKLPAIENDMEVVTAQAPVLPTQPYLPSLPQAGVATALGHMYVIEGSTLGGRILLKHIKGTLGFDEQEGARFFAGYGAETGPRWKHFLAVLTAYAVAEGCEDEIIAGANHAFSAIENHFS